MDLEGGTVVDGGGSNRSSNTTSPLSMLSSSTSEGVVVEHSDSEDTSEDGLTAVDGLVLMGSTRLRPGPEPGIDCDSKVGLYSQTFRRLFGKSDCTQAILPLALHGNLDKNPFRSLCWRIFLNVLPASSGQWAGHLQSSRDSYRRLSAQFHTDLKIQDTTIDPTINNPLSQDEESPWNQHFLDNELRKLIKQDVVRTFPEVDYFQSAEIREKLVSILFIYARLHPDLGYRQGMHELVAPLFYVIQSDCDTYQSIKCLAQQSADPLTAATLADLERSTGQLFDRDCVEADVYSLFQSLMDVMGGWFVTAKTRHSSSSEVGEGKPWSRPQDSNSGNKLVTNLNYIHDVLLKRHDLALYTRLEKLEIFPQIYGIRWLRLLFGREFSFRDTLLLWDTIFADSCPPSLCDQLVVALLVALRDLLLRYDYQDAVQLLMKLPSNLSVFYCSQFALYLKDPIRFPKPPGTAFTCGVRDPPSKLSPAAVSQRRWKPVKTDEKVRRQTDQGKKRTARELVKKSDHFGKFSVHQDKISDFTVLDLHTDTDKINQDLIKEKCDKFLELPSSSASSSSSDTPRVKTCGDRTGDNLVAVVNKLEKLLQQEKHLSKRSDIFHCLGSLKKLMTHDSGKELERKSRQKTASVAEDVASYFKIE